MLRPEHCRRRAERLRFALISTHSAVATARLRNFVEKYRVLEERAAKMIESPPLHAVEHERLPKRVDLVTDETASWSSEKQGIARTPTTARK